MIDAVSSEQPNHDGDLGHNSVVWYEDMKYIGDDGSSFYCEEVRISDKTHCVTLIPKEALSLLDWLQQERSTLERLVKEGK